MIDFDEIRRYAEKVATEWLVDQRRELPPTWLLFDATDKVQTFITPWGGDFEKQIAFATIRAHLNPLAEPKIVAYAYIGEMWMATREAGAVIRGEGGAPERVAPGTLRPSEDPKRREYVICYVSSRTERAQFLWDIVRDWKTTIRMLRADPEKDIREPIDGPTLGGAIPNMFRDAAP